MHRKISAANTSSLFFLEMLIWRWSKTKALKFSICECKCTLSKGTTFCVATLDLLASTVVFHVAPPLKQIVNDHSLKVIQFSSKTFKNIPLHHIAWSIDKCICVKQNGQILQILTTLNWRFTLTLIFLFHFILSPKY